MDRQTKLLIALVFAAIAISLAMPLMAQDRPGGGGPPPWAGNPGGGGPPPWAGGPPPWAGYPGGREAWEAANNTPVAPSTPVPPTSPPTASITLEQAVATALTVFPDATLVRAELTMPSAGPNAGRLLWDVVLNNGFAVYVDATTGAIVEIEPVRGVNVTLTPVLPDVTAVPTLTGTPSDSATITRQQAESIALALYPGATVVRAELTTPPTGVNAGRLLWDVVLSNQLAVYVDATTGQVVEIEPVR